jgi:SAM-dependent methyltransferase
MTPTFRDNFSKQAAEYAKFRPHYPEALFRYLADLCKQRNNAWDCGTGNGQCAIALADFFDQVIATDASQKQLDNATPHPRVQYRLGSAEESGLKANSVDLITVAQALHWFRIGEFWNEVRRALRSGGLIAVWCYGFLELDPKVDALLHQFYSEIVGPYWDFERKLVEEGYRSISFPFAEIEAPPFAIETSWSLNQLLGYLRSWSATQKFMEVKGRDPIELIMPELASAWDDASQVRAVKWPLSMRVGRYC